MGRLILYRIEKLSSSYFIMNQDQQQLKYALELLAQRILNTQEDHHVTLVKQLLIDIDPRFQQMLSFITSFPTIKPAIQSYYQEIRHEEIQWNYLLDRHQNFTLMCLFILDLAISNSKDNYIESILQLPEDAQMTLKTFVQEVTQRKLFISASQESQEDDRNREHLIELAEENEKLKQERDHWQHKYEDLKENYDYLKSTHDKMSEELNYLKQQRYTLINQLGGNECGSVDQIIQRVKRQMENYEKIVEKQQKQLEEKKTVLNGKNDELHKLEQTIKRNKYEEKLIELDEALKNISRLENELTRSRNNEDDLKGNIVDLKDFLTVKQQELISLKKQLSTLETYESKYLAIRKLHNQFKSKIVKNIKDPKQ